MTTSGSPASLQDRHAQIDGQIRSETCRPLPDAAAISQMKKAKLLIKDTLSAR